MGPETQYEREKIQKLKNTLKEKQSEVENLKHEIRVLNANYNKTSEITSMKDGLEDITEREIQVIIDKFFDVLNTNFGCVKKYSNINCVLKTLLWNYQEALIKLDSNCCYFEEYKRCTDELTEKFMNYLDNVVDEYDERMELMEEEIKEIEIKIKNTELDLYLTKCTIDLFDKEREELSEKINSINIQRDKLKVDYDQILNEDFKMVLNELDESIKLYERQNKILDEINKQLTLSHVPESHRKPPIHPGSLINLASKYKQQIQTQLILETENDADLPQINEIPVRDKQSNSLQDDSQQLNKLFNELNERKEFLNSTQTESKIVNFDEIQDNNDKSSQVIDATLEFSRQLIIPPVIIEETLTSINNYQVLPFNTTVIDRSFNSESDDAIEVINDPCIEIAYNNQSIATPKLITPISSITTELKTSWFINKSKSQDILFTTCALAQLTTPQRPSLPNILNNVSSNKFTI